MSRSVAWRRTCSDATSWHQDKALSATMFILGQIGPTGFLLKDDAEENKVHVFIGDPHRCTCSVFSKERDLCKHICWILLKKFGVSRHNPVTWQLGLVEREIQDLLRDSTVQPQIARVPPVSKVHSNQQTSAEQATVAQRQITDSDICPVCQDELLANHRPVTFCRNGCGNSVHIKCMTVWAEHQLRSTGKSNIECPFCRVDFGPLSSLQAELRGAASVQRTTSEHVGVVCQQCHSTPIVGKCYRCVTCSDVYLCQTCFNSASHADHPFHYRQKPYQRWSRAPQKCASLLPEAVISNLMAREISEEDYELLIQLDNNSSSQPSDLTETTIGSFPLHRVPRNGLLLAPGQQCQVCLRGYQEGDHVRRLPCRHRFHKNCIDNWLIHRHPTCPVDGIAYSNESVRLLNQANSKIKQQRHSDVDARKTVPEQCRELELELSGLKLLSPPEVAAQTKDGVFLGSIKKPSLQHLSCVSNDSSVNQALDTVVSREDRKKARLKSKLEESVIGVDHLNNVAIVQGRAQTLKKADSRSEHVLLTVITSQSEMFSSNENLNHDASQDNNGSMSGSQSSSSSTRSDAQPALVSNNDLSISGNVLPLNVEGSDLSRHLTGGLPTDSSKVKGHRRLRLKPLVLTDELASNKTKASQRNAIGLTDLYIGLNPLTSSPEQHGVDHNTHYVSTKTKHNPMTSSAGYPVSLSPKLVPGDVPPAGRQSNNHKRTNKVLLDELSVTGNQL